MSNLIRQRTNYVLNPRGRAESLRSEELRRNRYPNPRLVSTGAAPALYATGTSGNPAYTWQSSTYIGGQQPQGIQTARQIATNLLGATAADRVGEYLNIPAAPGDVLTASAYAARVSGSLTKRARITVEFRSATAALASASGTADLTGVFINNGDSAIDYGDVVRPRVTTAAAPAGTTTARVYLWAEGGPTGDTAADLTWQYGAVLVEAASTLRDYFDALTPAAAGGDVYAWTGTAHASASTLSSYLVDAVAVDGSPRRARKPAAWDNDAATSAHAYRWQITGDTVVRIQPPTGGTSAGPLLNLDNDAAKPATFPAVLLVVARREVPGAAVSLAPVVNGVALAAQAVGDAWTTVRLPVTLLGGASATPRNTLRLGKTGATALLVQSVAVVDDVVVTEARRNLCPNPRLVSTGTVPGQITASNTGTVTRTFSTGIGAVGYPTGVTTARQIAASALGVAASDRAGDYFDLPVAPSTAYAFSVYLRRLSGSVTKTFRMRVDWVNAANAVITAGVVSAAAAAVSDTTVRRLSGTATAPADAAVARVYVWAEGAGGVAEALTFDYSAMLVEASTLTRDYFDGDTADAGTTAYDWSGTANASASTESAWSLYAGPYFDGDTATVGVLASAWASSTAAPLTSSYQGIPSVTVVAEAEPAASNHPPRVRLTITDSDPLTPVRAVSVLRIDSSGRRTPVRAADGEVAAIPLAATGSAATLYDYEAPLGVGSSYVLADDLPHIGSVRVTPDDPRPWLIHPGVPARSRPVSVVRLGKRRRRVVEGVYDVQGRPDPIVRTDGRRKSAESELVLRTYTDAEREALDLLLDDATALLLSIPPGRGWGLTYEWVAIGDSDEDRTADTGTWPRRLWTLPYRVVGRPIGGTRSARTWHDVAKEAASWRDLARQYDSWADVADPTTEAS